MGTDLKKNSEQFFRNSFQGNKCIKIDLKGVILEINYFKGIEERGLVGSFDNLKLNLNIIDDLGKTVNKQFIDNIEVIKNSENSISFRAQFKDGKIREAEYMNHTHTRSGNEPPYQTSPSRKAKVIDKTLKEGDEFYVVEFLNQQVPGGFWSKDPIFTIKDLREKLSVIEAWKNPEMEELVIRKYKVLKDIQVRDGYIGPMTETLKTSKNFNKTYKGGGHQYESLKKFKADDVYVKDKGIPLEGKTIERIEEFETKLK